MLFISCKRHAVVSSSCIANVNDYQHLGLLVCLVCFQAMSAALSASSLNGSPW
jgi:hypothetical protein